MLDCEEVSRREARRTIVLRRDLKAGERITEDAITFRRQDTGIIPKYTEVVLGRSEKCDLMQDTILGWDMI